MAEDFKYAFLVGAPKCGTTALVSWFARHPEVFALTDKEPGFFRSKTDWFILNAQRPDEVQTIPPNHPMRSETAYRALAQDAKPGQWILDGSTDYLSDKGAPNRIRAFTAGREVRIICILRDPVERAYSEYLHTRRDGQEPLSFLEAIEAEPERMVAGYQPLFFHLRRSRYYDDLQLYISTFGRDSVLILDHNEFREAPEALGAKLCTFLKIAPADLGTPEQLNVSIPHQELQAANRLKRRARFAIRRILGSAPEHERTAPPLSDADRRYVFERLEDDIRACIADPTIPTGRWAPKP